MNHEGPFSHNLVRAVDTNRLTQLNARRSPPPTSRPPPSAIARSI